MAQESETAQDTQIYARFVFMRQQQALDFADLVGEHDGILSVSFSPERGQWQATVRQQMQPLFRDITVWLATLTARAATVGGESDGWGKSRHDA